MVRVSVRNLGVSALMIEGGGRRIQVDAFNDLIEPTKVLTGDILLFTHDDGDHFCPDRLPVVKNMDITIAGPPSIVKPILMQNKADIEQIEVLYTNKYAKRDSISFDNIKIYCFNTQHFNHWDPIHNSYLIEISGKRIYITGDSELTKEQAENIGETDAVICNLVDEAYLKAEIDANTALHHNLSYLLKVRSEGRTKMVIGVHLLDFDWTVEASDMNKLVEAYGFSNIIISVDPNQKIMI